MSFKIRTQPGGQSFEVAPDETLLAGALRHGITLPYGCRDGRCGSCAARLLHGQVDYPAGIPEALAGQAPETCLTCQAVARSDLLIEVRACVSVAPVDVRTLPCRVVKKERLNHDVLRLFLRLPEQQCLSFQAGQYLELILRDGRRRAFSIANAPRDDHQIELHIRRVPGGELTTHVFETLPEKAILRIRGPLGVFVLREDSPRPIILLGGGTGFAPLKGMIEQAIQSGLTRPIRLYWGVRSRRDLYLRALVEHWAETLDTFDYVPVLSEPDQDWTGRTGYVHAAVIEDHPDLRGFDVYVSGPPAMVASARSAFQAHGLPLDQLFSDAFEYAKDGPPDASDTN